MPATTPHTTLRSILQHNVIHNHTNTTHSECGHTGKLLAGKGEIPNMKHKVMSGNDTKLHTQRPEIDTTHTDRTAKAIQSDAL